MNELKCGTCFYWNKNENNDSGRCVAQVPTCTLVMQQGFDGAPRPAVITFWPETRSVDWCGQWKAGR